MDGPVEGVVELMLINVSTKLPCSIQILDRSL